jgi:hypothetical protein
MDNVPARVLIAAPETRVGVDDSEKVRLAIF